MCMVFMRKLASLLIAEAVDSFNCSMSAYCRCAASNCCPGLVSSQYFNGFQVQVPLFFLKQLQQYTRGYKGERPQSRRLTASLNAINSTLQLMWGASSLPT
eukprot:437866-Pelagomonas_calceolata.AAC.2